MYKLEKPNSVLYFALIIYTIATLSLDASEATGKLNSLIIFTKDGEAKLEVSLKPSLVRRDSQSTKAIPILPFQIVAEPAGSETAEADRNLPEWVYILKGCKAYKIFAKGPSGNPVGNDQIKDTFTLGLSYPENIKPGLEKNLKLFILHENRWLPLKCRTDLAQRMVRTDSAQQFGIYRLMVQADINPQKDIFVYPNPVQFGEFGKGLKFRNVPPGSVIEIYTVTGEQIRETDVRESVVIWDGKKGNGDLVTSGLYLYRIQMVGKEAFGKIVVLR